ncbi:unnamed protein product, partial [Rotaria sp. Silwood2]
STPSKMSYHFIHANPTVLFQNTQTLKFYLKTIFHSLLFAIAKHECLSLKLTIDSKTISIENLVSLLSPHITKLRTNCSNCFILNKEVSVADIAHLIVRKKNDQWSLSVDLHVYCKNQQFRLYDSIKIGSNNPLTTTSNYPFQQTKSHCYFDILRKSLITNTSSIHTSLIILKDKYLFRTQTPLRLNYESIHIDNMIVKTYNPKDLNDFQFIKSSLSSCHKEKTKNISFIQKKTEIFTNAICNSYIPFIQNIITQDNKHIGKIESFVQGNRNTNKLIFNITGNYRFCPKIAAHHKRNCTAIIIDISNNTYAIRCKDPECDNTFLTWNDTKNYKQKS